jgi:hypothetical protein
MFVRGLGARAVVLAFATLIPVSAYADVTRAECAAAYERAQYMRRETKLRAVQEALVVCAQQGCPVATRNDCLPWLAEVEAAVPTVVVGVRDENGRDLGGMRISIDGVDMPNGANGIGVPVDPGPHTIRAAHAFRERPQPCGCDREQDADRAQTDVAAPLTHEDETPEAPRCARHGRLRRHCRSCRLPPPQRWCHGSYAIPIEAIVGGEHRRAQLDHLRAALVRRLEIRNRA